MNKQEIFETVAKHLIQQGRPAKAILHGYDNTPKCAYRGKNGTSCAVGCLIPDELYVPEMENKTSSALIEKFDLPPYFRENEGLLANLQSIHDNDSSLDEDGIHFSKEEVIDRLRGIAKYYKLDAEFLKGL